MSACLCGRCDDCRDRAAQREADRVEAEAAMQRMCPGEGGWAAYDVMRPKQALVGILEHRGHGPASRLVLGRSSKGFGEAIQKAAEKIERMAEPPQPKPKKESPKALPQEELPLPARPPEED